VESNTWYDMKIVHWRRRTTSLAQTRKLATAEIARQQPYRKSLEHGAWSPCNNFALI